MASRRQTQWPTHLGRLPGLLQVVVDPGDQVGIEARQRKEGGGRGRCTKRVDVPGELWPDPKCFIEKPVSFCKDSIASLVPGRGACASPLTLTRLPPSGRPHCQLPGQAGPHGLAEAKVSIFNV